MSLHNVFVKRILLIITLSFSFQFAFAGSGTSVIQGNPATINWNIVGGTDSCNGTTDYPNIADGVQTWWQTNHASTASHTFPAINAPAGTYTFTCTDGVLSDSATLTVTSGTPPTGSFSPRPADCVINAGFSTCTTSSFSWVVNNPVSPLVKNNGSTIYSAASGSGTGVVGYGTNSTTFTLNDTLPGNLDSQSVSGTCLGSTAWNGATCQTCLHGGCGTTAPPNQCNNGTTNPPTCDACPSPATQDFNGSICIAKPSIPSGAPPSGANGTAGFYVMPTPIPFNTASNLYWSSSGATSCSITASSGANPNTGGATSNGAGLSTGARTAPSTTFTLTCTNGIPSSDVTATAVLTVTPQAPFIGATFIATPNPVTFNNPTTLSWNVGGTVTSCTLSGGEYGGGIPVLANDNRTTSNLITNTTYTLSCSGPGGTDSQNLTVNVGGPPVASFTGFTFLPTTVISGAASTLTWTTNNATSVSINCTSGPAAAQTAWNAVGLGRNSNKSVTSNASMIGVTPCIATAHGLGGDDTQGFTWTVNTPAPTIATFTNSGPIMYGTSATLSWTGVTDSTTCSIDNGIGSVSTSNSSTATGNLITSTTYTITCTGPGGSAAKSTIVSVGANTSPVVSITPASNQTITLGQSIAYSSNATDAENNMTQHKFDWMGPGGQWNYNCGNCEGTFTAGPAWSFGATNSSAKALTFTPTVAGTYTVLWAASDGIAPWGVSASKTITVNPVSGSITAGDCVVPNGQPTCNTPTTWTTNTPTWRLTSCRIDGSSACSPAANDYDYTDPDLGPHNLTMTGDPAYRRVFNLWKDTSWGLPLVAQQIYRGNCTPGSYWNGSICTFGTHSLTATAVGSSGAGATTVAYDCSDNTNVQSIGLKLSHGATTDYTANATTTKVGPPETSDSFPGFIENTTYTYTLTCYQGTTALPGKVLGTKTVNVTTQYATPSVTPGGTCSNGSNNPPTCDVCNTGTIYDGVRCVPIGWDSVSGKGTMCVNGTITNGPTGQTGIGYTGAVCGDGTVQVGEECDGVGSLSDPTKQQCSNTCTISCLNNLQAPGCGAAAFCTNGAKQSSASSAPACNQCPNGQTYTGGKCVTPVCGNGIKEGQESCDIADGTPFGLKCTTGCCITNPAAASCYPTFSITCSGGNFLSAGVLNTTTGTQVTNAPFAAGTTTYSGVMTWTPTSPGNYQIMCINGNYPTYKIASTVQTVSGSCAANGSPSDVTLVANPKTIKRGGSTSITWKATSPNGVCKIVAQPVITAPTGSLCDASCVVRRQNEANRITNLLAKSTTDASDPYGASRTLSNALTNLVNGYAQGKKSIQLQYSTEFIGTCALNPFTDPKAVKVRVNVAEDVEG